MIRPALIAVCALVLVACARTPPASPPTAAKHFSMRTYHLALLRRGPSWTAERTAAVEELGRGHMANIRRMGASGKLVIAGPFNVEDGAPRDAVVGIFIFDVPTREEAVALTRADPAIAAGHFSAEVLEWYGPSGLTYDGRDEELAKIRREAK